MDNSPETFHTFIDRFIADRLQPEEVEQFFLFLEQENFQDQYGSGIDMDLLEKAYRGWSHADQPDKLYQQILQQANISGAPVHRIPFFKTVLFKYAASILVVVGLGTYIWTTNQSNTAETVQNETAPSIIDVPSPQSTHAFITMGNGQQIMLDSAGNGVLAMEGNIRVDKTADGSVAYSGNSTIVQYHTLVNPKGSRVVHIKLADGTNVWLNAASSLRYPNVFVDSDRNVSIIGEAYFEVAHNALKPFIVTNGSTSVKVLGTHFNVNSYPDEDGVAITLLEGLVNVQHKGAQQLLTLGQQAQVKKDGVISLNQQADIDQVMAWKNEMFRFDKTDLRIIMRQIERWYNVEVEYATGVQPQLYNGEIPRDVPVSEVLKILQYTGAHFKIEENKITVMP